MENNLDPSKSDQLSRFSDQSQQAAPVVIHPHIPAHIPQPKKNGMYFLIGLLLLFVVAACAYALGQMNRTLPKPTILTALSPTEVPPTPTTQTQMSENRGDGKTFTDSKVKKNNINAGWKKYTNKLQNYSIEYPPNYVIGSYSKLSESFVVYSSQDILNHQSQYPNADELKLTVWADLFSSYPPRTHSSLRDYVYKEDHESGLVAANVTWLKIKGVEVAKETMGDIDRYYWLHNGYLYFIDVQPNNTTLKSDVNKILASFTFIKPDPNTQVMISVPELNSPVHSPLIVRGTAPSGWMFEGVVGVQLLDHNNKVLAQTQGKEITPGSWQSGKPVEFSAELIFDQGTFPHSLVIIKDNPSGLPENDENFLWPVRFE